MKQFPGQPIPDQEFQQMRKRFVDENPNQTHSVLFGVESFERLQKQGAKGIRIYFGTTEAGENTVIMKATDEQGKDLPDDGEDRGQLCPPYCPDGLDDPNG